MLLLIAFATAYLLITLVYSTDCFIRSAMRFIVFGCAYAASTFLNNDYFFYFFAAIATVAELSFFRITLTDLVKLAIICLIAIFWLSTAEFVDGYAYSELFVTLGIAVAANLLFSASNRRCLCVVAIIISYGLTINKITYFNALTFAFSLCVGWALCQTYDRPTEQASGTLNLFK